MNGRARRRATASGALGVLIAVAACGDGVRPTAQTEAMSDADQVLYGMTHFVTQDGVVRARVEADTAYFYNSTQTVQMQTVRVTFFDTQGTESSTLTARAGTFYWRTQNLDGRGSVVVRTPDGRRLETEVLRYNHQRNEVSSDVPFVFDAPDRHIEGEGFTSDPGFRNVVATKPTGRGGEIRLPNQ